MIYPIRINKYLAEEKICSRREADRLIKQGKVKVNGTQAQLGEKICETDKITIDGDLKNLVYVAFNKPKGVVVHSSQEGETSIKDILKLNFEVFPLGRLEKDSSGLVLLTNDGRVTDRLLNPEYHHEKENQDYYYSVCVIDRFGQICLTHRKVHLWEWGVGNALSTPGKSFDVCELNTKNGNLTLGVMICADWYFPESARILMLNGVRKNIE